MWPEAGSEEFKTRFMTQWHEKWTYLPNGFQWGNDFTYSFYKIYLYTQILFSKLTLTNDLNYSLIFGSIISRILILASFLLISREFFKNFTPIIASICTSTLALVFLETAWMALFNTFYEEQMAIILLPLIYILLYSYQNNKKTSTALLILLISMCIGLTKTAYFLTPLIALSIILLNQYNIKQTYLLIALGCIAQILCIYPVIRGQYSPINSYHSLYFGQLTLLDNNSPESIKQIDNNPIIKDCINVNAFSPEGSSCIEKTNVRYSDTLKLIIKNPKLLMLSVEKILKQAQEVKLDYLSTKLNNSPNFSNFPIFNTFNSLFKHGYAAFFLAIFLTMSLCTFIFRKKSFIKNNAFISGALFIGLFGLYQYLIALGDGFYELQKHILIANFSLALLLPATLAAISAIAIHFLRHRFHLNTDFVSHRPAMV